MRFSRAIFAFLALSVGYPIGGCSSGDGNSEPTCLSAAASTSCTPLYTPTFDNVWKNTLSKTCAATDCHSGATPKGNMALDDEDKAYTNLLGKSANGEPRVTAGDVKCGKVIVRTHTKGESYSMPPNLPLGDTELCSLTQWIAMGAMR